MKEETKGMSPQAAASVIWRVGMRIRMSTEFVVSSVTATGITLVDCTARHTFAQVQKYLCEGAWTILADSPGSAPGEVVVRSSAILPPAVGMVIEFARGYQGVAIVGKGRNRRTLTAEMVKAGSTHTDSVMSRYWDNGDYDILSMPPAAHAHVCKGRPCGEALTWQMGLTGWFIVREATKDRYFCSPACRDAWKPEAKAATLGEMLAAGQAARKAASCDGHREAAQPAPAPWKCKNERCRTPDAGQARFRNGTGTLDCVACHDRHVAYVMASCKKPDREALEPIAAFHDLTRPAPARRPATDGLPGGASTGRNDSVWGDS